MLVYQRVDDIDISQMNGIQTGLARGEMGEMYIHRQQSDEQNEVPVLGLCRICFAGGFT